MATTPRRTPPPGLLLLLLLALAEGGGGWGSLGLPAGCKQDGGSGGGRPRSSSSSKASPVEGGKVVCSSLELAHVLPADALPNRTVTLSSMWASVGSAWPAKLGVGPAGRKDSDKGPAGRIGVWILSSNKISELKNGSFAGLSLLERLDLRNNFISTIDPGAFGGLSSLKRLDLTNNRIGCLNADIFKGLANLIRLNLSGNLFSSLTQGTFDHLISLKSLEFQTDYLLCDCNMLWLQRWLQERNITVRETRCAYPKSLQAQPVLSVKQELLTCDPPLELPSFYMTPSHRQVVFEGDSLPFHCTASYIDQDMQVLWYQDGKIVETNESQGIFVEKNMIHSCSLIAR
ncbi:hypothetical protein lerEdw1_019122 [Lerista edwardsae]|nr:hypothetical protein lerEdw1_019122 [Lerista edwardsae]